MAQRNVSRAPRARRNSSVLTSLILSAGLVIAALVVRSNKSHEATAVSLPAPVVGEFDLVKVPVPVEPVAAGSKLSSVEFKTLSYPVHQVPKGSVTDIAPFLNSTTLTSLPANLPVFRENLSASGVVANPVVEMIPEGMRAMTIRVDATSAVEGWAGSGSLVDVLLVKKEKTSVVAENIKILSAERSLSPVDGNRAPSVPNTVTLLVTQEQCLAINTAIQQGKIAFALRGVADSEHWGGKVFTADSLEGANKAPRGRIKGFITVKEKGEQKSFALMGDRWIKSEGSQGDLVQR